MIQFEIFVFIVLAIFFFYKLNRTTSLKVDCWVIMFGFLLIEVYAIISLSISGMVISETAFPLAIGTMASAVLGYHVNKNILITFGNNNRRNVNTTTTKSKNVFHEQGLFVFFLIMIFIGTFRYQGLPPVITSYSTLLRGGYSYEDAVKLTQDRKTISKAHYFGGSYRGQGLTKALQMSGWPLLCTTALVIYLRTKKRRDMFLFLFFLFFGIMYLSGDGTRLPPLILLITCVITYLQRREVSLVKASKYFLLLIMFLMFHSALSVKQYKLFADGITVSALLTSINSILDRMFLANAWCDMLAINYIDNGLIPLQSGMLHLHQLLNALPGVSVKYPSFSYMLGQVTEASSSTSYYSTTYLGIAYADFGFIGAIIAYFIVGSFCGLFNSFLERRFNVSYNPIDNAFYSCLSWGVGCIVISTFVGFLIGLGISFSLYFLFKFLVRIKISALRIT